MADIKFRDTAHRDFFLENMMKCRGRAGTVFHARGVVLL